MVHATGLTSRNRLGALILISATLWHYCPAAEPAAGESAAADVAARGYLSGNGLLNRGLYELAVAEYRSFLDQHPDHEKAPAARYGLGVCLFRMDKFEQAAVELSPLLDKRDFMYAAEARTMVAQSFMSLQRFPEANAHFEKVVETYAEHALAPAAAAGAAEGHYRANNLEEAVFWGRQVRDRWPQSPHRSRAEFFVCLAEMAGQEFAAAAKACGLSIELDPTAPFAEQATLLLARCNEQAGSSVDAVANYERVLTRPESNQTADALLSLGSLHYREGRLEEAARHLDRLLEVSKDAELVSPAVLLRGRIWFDQNQWDRAFDMFERARQSNAGDDMACEAAYWMAKCRLRQEKSSDAAAQLREAVQRFTNCPLAPELTYDLSVALLKKGDINDAIEVLRGSLSRFNDHSLTPDALYLLAVSEHQRGKFDESLLCCDEFIKRFSEHESAATVGFLGAENEFLAGRYPQAVVRLRKFLERYPSDARVLLAKLRLGTALYRGEQLDEASLVLTQVIEAKPPTDEVFSPAWLALGDIHFQRGEWKSAEENLQKYVSSSEDVSAADDARLKLGLSIQRQGRAAEAVAVYDELLAKHPQSPHRTQAMFERGQALLAMDRRDDAERAFKAVLEAGENSRFAAHALNHLAAIAALRGDSTQAAALYGQAATLAGEDELGADALLRSGRSEMEARRFDAAASAFSRFLEAFPADPRRGEVHGLLGTAMARNNQCEEALTALDAGVGQLAADADAGLRASFLYEKAWCLRSLEKSEQAVQTYRAAVDLGPSTVRGHALLELAGLEMKAGRYESAGESLRNLRELADVDDARGVKELREQGTYQLAVCEFELKQPQKAAELFEEFIRDYPSSPLMTSASFLAGEASFQQGRLDAAAEHLTRVAEKYSSDALFGPALVRLGECQAMAQRWQASERAYTDYLDRFADNPQSFQARFGVGWAREQQKRYDEAIRAYELVVASHQGPTAARAQFQIGECLFAQNRYEEAVRELLKVDILFAYPEWSAAALYEAGRCFEKMNKQAEAKDQFRVVTSTHGGTRWADLATQRLSELSMSASVPGR